MRERHYLKVIFLAIFCFSLLQIVSWLPFAGHVPTASAQAFVIGSDPIDGSTISKPPSLVRIYFDAPIAPASAASVYAFPPDAPANGLLVNAGHSNVNASNPKELDVRLLPAGKLPPGSYEVRWVALSMTDGRTTSGLIGFNLGASSTGLSGTPLLGPSTSNYFPQLDLQGVLAVAWDWLVLLALLFWIGILLTDYIIVPRSAPAAFLIRVRKHSRSLRNLSLLALLVGEVISLVLRSAALTQTSGSGGISLSVLGQFILQTNYGRLWLARVVLLLIALLLLWWNNRREGQPHGTPVKFLSGHASKHFRQLRQQARAGSSQEPPATSSSPASTYARSQARVTGAVVTNISPARGTTAALPRITLDFGQDESPVYVPSTWQVVSQFVLIGLILLTLVLSNEIIQLAALPISAGVFSWLSLAAQAAWFGCTAYLGLVLLPQLLAADPDHHAEILVIMLKRALPLLLASIGVLLVSELFLSEATIQTPSQFLTDPYGRTLMVRASLLLLLLIFTGYTLFTLLPRLQRQTILLPVVHSDMPARRTRQFALEKTERTIKRALHTLSGLAAAVLLCTALMNFFSPPVVFPNVNYAALANQAASGGNLPTSASSTQQAGGLAVTLQALPARTNTTNTVILIINDAQGRPVSGATVKLSINMIIMDMGTATATAKGNGSVYSATFTARQTFTMAGAWAIQVEVLRANQPPVHLMFQITVAQ